MTARSRQTCADSYLRLRCCCLTRSTLLKIHCTSSFCLLWTMNKFNVKRKQEAGKTRRVNAQLRKKKQGLRQHHQRQVQKVSGQRSGKGKAKAKKQQNLQKKVRIARGVEDVVMQPATQE